MTKNEEIRNAIEVLFNYKAVALPPHAFADVFDRLLWCLDDNGSAILRLQEEWLEREDNLDRLKTALLMKEVRPFNSMAELREAMRTLSKRKPELVSQCKNMLALWESKG